MTIEAEIQRELKLSENKRRKATKKISDFWYKYDKRLNDPVWLIDQLITKGQTDTDIAKLIGCSEWLVHDKVKKIMVTEGQIFNVYTGFFHYTKLFLIPLLKPRIKKIQQGVDSVYNKTHSRNSKIFKDLIDELEIYDDDTEASIAKRLGFTRKAFILLAVKFLVCLYEYDLHYAERMDYMLKRILERKDELYLDPEIVQPENWYPHRNLQITTEYMIKRNQ